MKLEDEIKQSKFANEFQKLAINLIFTGNWLNAKSSEYLKQFGITIQQYNVLRILRGRYPEPATVNLIIERMLDKMPNASRIVDKLLLKKFVERKTCTEDRRCVDVMITEKGLKLLSEIEKKESILNKKFTSLSIKEAKEINRYLDKLRD